MKKRTARSARRSIRARMLAIVLIPSALLLIIGGGAATYLVREGSVTQDWAELTRESSSIDISNNFVKQFGEERKLSLQFLGGDNSVADQLKKQRAESDSSVTRLFEIGKNNIAANEDAEAATKEADRILGELMAKLPEMRQGVDARLVPALDVYTYYNSSIDILSLALLGVASTSPDPTAAVEATTAAELFGAAEAMFRSNALALGGVGGTGLDDKTFQEYALQVGNYHGRLNSLMFRLTKDEQAQLTGLMKSKPWQQLVSMESVLIARGPGKPAENAQPLPVPTADWQNAAEQVHTELLDIYAKHHTYGANGAYDTGHRNFINSLLAGIGILLVAIIGAVVAVRLSNRLVKRMKQLRMETLELADVRLPRIVQRVRGGAQIDLDTEMPPLDYGSDELGQVAGAFNQAQRTAVAAAAQEAEIQNGVRTVFLNIAHRSQVVVRRQLEVLDKAEREQEDPEQLELLFQLDHLATRARRSAENLLILGGERPGRRWRNPVPLVEIVRSAIGETEHYRRVNTGRMPDLLISGAAVADVIHLLAELVDNATAFSPPDSRVEVRSNRVGRGVVVEIEDQGVGLSREERDDINNFLQSPPDFGVMALTEDEARLGLFVISQLAFRHGISVTLVDSAYGGVRAIVLIRSALIADPGEDAPEDRQLGAGPATGPTMADRRRELPAPRQELTEQVMTAQTMTAPPGRSSIRPPVSDDLSWPAESPAEQTIQWTTWGTSDNGTANGIPPVAPNNDTSSQGPAIMPGMASRGGAPADTSNGRGGDGATGGKRPLPRRRRQANIAPQLAADEEPWPAEPDMSESVDPALLAEKARHRMAALQRGTREGRAAE